MKLNLKIAVGALCAALLAALTAFGAMGCVDQTVTTLGTEANLTSLMIGSVRAQPIPAPISASVWNEDNRSLLDEPLGNLQFNRASDITQARIRPGTSRGARAEWCIGSKTFCSDEFMDTRVPASFESDEYIYIKVTSEDLAVVNYYRFYTRVYSWVTDLASITISERETKPAGSAGTYQDLIGGNVPQSMIGELNITRTEARNAVITPNPFDPNSTVRFAKTKSAAIPSFVSADTPISFDDEDWLFVEVTAENTVDKAYFKYRVYVGRMTDIASLKFTGGDKKEIELFGLGTPAISWRSVSAGEFATAKADQPAGGFGIDITLEDPEATVDWQIYRENSLPGTSGLGINTPMDKQKREFNSKDYLVIRVKALNGGGAKYFSIQVTLLAANIKEHPKSAWYYADYVTGPVASIYNRRPAAPLTVELEGAGAGPYTYQWYTSDSLFGIYGRHGMSIDEKNNISTINGGPDMYYYLAEPGINQYGGQAQSYVNEESLTELAWEIEGATLSSYTPRNDWVDVPVKYRPGSSQNSTYPYDPSKPLYETGPTSLEEPKGGWPTPAPNHVNFFTGATCEVRYYWVVITDQSSGLTVTSDRAVILTETNPKMKHYVFELTKLPRRKNLKPFTFLRELHEIPIDETFWGPDFDTETANYALCTAQARYYLPDGRPWTQNWTHGDLHFGYYPPKDPITWWHNNLGSNSGAIPLQTPHSAQGGLTQPPDWVGFAPSGDKGRGLPPLDSRTGQLPIGYKPQGYPEGKAQGYFCGFIELLELRFSISPTD